MKKKYIVGVIILVAIGLAIYVFSGSDEDLPIIDPNDTSTLPDRSGQGELGPEVVN